MMQPNLRPDPWKAYRELLAERDAAPTPEQAAALNDLAREIWISLQP